MQKDKYIPIHNRVAEALAKINLSPYESRVLWVIFRKTYGYLAHEGGRKKKADIPYSEITEMTGLDRRLISRAISGLLEKSVITRDDKGLGLSKQFMSNLSSVPMTTTKQQIKSDLSSVVMTSTPAPVVISRDDSLSSLEMTNASPLNNPLKSLKKKESPLPPKGDVVFAPQAAPDKKQIIKTQAIRILAHLNKVTKSWYQENDTNLGFIEARLKEKGVTEYICIAIIDHKTFQWLTKPMKEGLRRDECPQAEYLRPATLFNRTKFWQYHGQVTAWMESRAEKRKVEASRNRDSGDTVIPEITPEQQAKNKAFLEKLKRNGTIKNTELGGDSTNG